MAATKKFMVGKGNIWIFPGKWWFDCMIVITGHCFEKTSLLLVVASEQVPAAVAGAAAEESAPSAPSKKWWHVADAEIEQMLAEKQGKDQVWWLLGGWRMVMCQILKSWVLTFFFWGGGMKNQFRFFLILCFWMLVKKVALDHFWIGGHS